MDYGDLASSRLEGSNHGPIDVSIDLGELDIFVTQVGLYISDNAIVCRVFATSLNGLALCYFTDLPPNSIDCFETLVTHFGIQFETSKPYHLTYLPLVKIRQEKNELLWVFIERFGKVALNIHNLIRM